MEHPISVELPHPILAIAKRGTEYRHGHARKCDGTRTIKLIHPETLEESKVKIPCEMCREAQKWFESLPPDVLSVCLEEPETVRVKISLATLLVDSTLERGTHRSKRAKADTLAGLALLKEYEKNGGKLSVKV